MTQDALNRENIWLHPLEAALTWRSEGAHVHAWRDTSLALDAECTHYLFAAEGLTTLTVGERTFTLYPNMFASVPGECAIASASAQGAGMVVSHRNYQGVFQMGGPIEARGRLRYIDGCTDSLLLPPPVLGDPCFNHLHIPAGTAQSEHTHPSVRIGMIVRGQGLCITGEVRTVLHAGLVFILPPGLAHSFHTQASSLDVVVYHPESDMGPTDLDHPMLNRTYRT